MTNSSAAHPDAERTGEIEATGLAFDLVQQHQDPQDLDFYAGWFCPFVQRVWIALEERSIEYRYHEVNPYKKEPHFLKINPKGLVPAIEHHGKALPESLIILEYLEDAYDRKMYKPLRSGDAYETALVRLGVEHIGKIVAAFYKYVQAQEVDKQQECKKAFITALQDLINNYFVTSESGLALWSRGSEFGLLDVCLAPWIARLFMLQEERGFEYSDVDLDGDGGKKFSEYAHRILDHPSVKRTTSHPDAYRKAYQRYFSDTAQSEVGKATRTGEKLP